MEKILCDIHGSLCMLKTGVKDGPSNGKSFYVCVDKQGCNFSHVTSVSPSHCLQHEDSMVELQALSYSLQQQNHRLFYRCVAGKQAGQRWCGNVPWTAPEKDKRNPLSGSQLQPSCLPPVRNPFKAPGKMDQDSEWRRMQRGGGEAEGRGGHQKENVERGGPGGEEATSSADCYRGKQLPPGMKLKKRVSHEERNSSKENHMEHGETEIRTSASSVKETSQTSQDPHKDSTQRPTGDPAVKKTVSTSAPRSSTPTSSDKSRNPPTSSDNSRNPPNSSDKSRHPPTSSDTSRNPPTSSDTSRNTPTSSDTSRNPPTSSDKSRHPPTSSDTSRNPPNSSDKSRHPPTSSDTSRNPPNSSDKSRNPPTSSDKSRNPQTSSDNSRNPPNSSDKSRNPPTSSDNNRNPPTSSDNSRNPPTSSDNSRNPPTSSDNNRNPPTSSDNSRNPPTSSDNSRNPPTSSDTSRNPPTSSDNSRNPPTSSDNSRNPPTSSDKSRNPPTSSDNNRNPPTSSDNSRNPPTSSDNSRNPPTSSDNNRNPPTSSDNSRNPPTSSDNSRNPPTSSDTSRNPPTSSDNSRNPPTSSDNSRNPPTSSDNSRNPPTCSDNSRNPPTSSDNSRNPPTSSDTSRNPPTSSDTSRNPTTTKAAPSDSSQTNVHHAAAAAAAADDDDDGDDDDVVVVSVKPATQKTPPVSTVQKTLTTFAGFQPASKVKGQQGSCRDLLAAQLQQKKATLSVVNVAALPDKGERLRTQVKELEEALESLNLTAASQPESQGGQNRARDAGPGSSQMNPFSRQGGTILLPAPPGPGPSQDRTSSGSLGLQLSQGYSQMSGVNPQVQSFYGGRMTADRLLAVKNATCETIDHLHRSLESRPDAEAEAAEPRGIKVCLLPHQRRALAWLLWRENQNPCGGILADDMGLGKTLTMIALILATKMKKTEEAEEKPEGWVSRADSSLLLSKGTLIICPASLIHHWKREIDRHVKTGRLTVYLYHGPNREKRARVLADYDVVVTTYSLVSKEIPVQKDEADKPSKDADAVPASSAPLLRVTWARVVLDEAHNIKNPKVQTSMAVCQLRAGARWAVTGTPIQNNLLDMYSLLKFLRCSPFDEYKVWKAQVDNGSNRGRERLNILTRTLLLRRTKDQRDAAGQPLVSLPDRTCEVHQLRLSEDEQAVYDVVFAQSRSTLQNYLKRHEGNDVKTGKTSTSNPFDKVAQEFGLSQTDPAVSSSQQPQQASSTVHILSLLLRLRQCCCHLSLLKKTLDTSELQGDGIVLSLEEQLNALSLSSSPSPSGPRPSDTVALNGTRFPSQLFEDTSESTKIAAIISELKAIRQKSDEQKSVIVSQWTSMLKIVAVHLRQMGLKYAVIDGTVAPKHRMDLVEEFNTNRHGPQVMLVSLCAGGVGLNLIGGNHLFLIDMHWNPALEDQACDRIYRVGQRKDVTIHRFVCDGTVEEKISTLQAKKKELAQNVLSGTGSTFSKLSLADLRIIFGV